MAIFIYPVQRSDEQFIQPILDCLHSNDNALLTLSPKGIYFNKDVDPSFNFHYHFTNDNEWQYEERIGYKNTLFIIGGGHCALALSKLFNQMDFYIHLYDDRENLNTYLQNDYIHEKAILNDYTQLKDLIPAGDHHYVTIMTFGYRTDDTALRSLLYKDFCYTGLLGSRHKIEKMFEDYRKEGIKEEWLQRIHTPIGLAIKSQTPEEIAVSIAAEIIQLKNKDQ